MTGWSAFVNRRLASTHLNGSVCVLSELTHPPTHTHEHTHTHTRFDLAQKNEDGVAYFWSVASREHIPTRTIRTAVTFHVIPLREVAETRFSSLAAAVSFCFRLGGRCCCC